ncbi:MAG: ATP-grasp fold amidoligase family protein [Candidatus Cryptobacteroides sp.]|nr:ATP-grasp fold amidoligase family protein [Bacteroidales bacterium]MDY6157683.1 ATP-grasp fold amidoligase family protein [Candidatus Cryptobacteroides sp.]
MLLLLFIGLFTSRVVLAALGETDYGVYNAVGGMVTVFTFLTASISSAISRFLAFELGNGGDATRMRKLFSAGIAIQLVFALVLVILAETAGLWFLHHRMNIPDGRMGAAEIVLQCTLVALVIQLLAIPYNAAIIAREKMSAFAFISLLEAGLKLAVALMVKYCLNDRLVLYAFLMAAVALVVRMSYGYYCRRHFPESRGKLIVDRSLLREIFSFSGWNFFGSSSYVLNTQGVTILVNIFFGVALNAARGVALQIENIAKQFVSNFLTAINPQITKSWASGNRDYCFSLVAKGVKFSLLVILAFFLPLYFEAECALDLWLAKVPAHSADFVRLALVGLLVDMVGNPLLTLILATGKVRNYYLLTGLTSYLCLPLAWLAFKLGAPVEWSYVSFILIYLIVLLERFVMARRIASFPLGKFFRSLAPMLQVFALAFALAFLAHLLMPQGLLRLLLVCAVSWLALLGFTCLLALTPGERAFLTRKLGRHRVPLKWALEDEYYEVFGRRPDLNCPRRYTEKLQKMILHDHNPLYHRLVDKAEVKSYVSSLIGEEHIIPTLGVWSRAEDIDWDSLPDCFVLKCTHDSGSALICRDKASFDREAACEKLGAALSRDYWKVSREWAYKGVKPRIIAEAYLGDDVADYKFFCFNGKPELLFVATERQKEGEEVKFDFFDMSFNHLDIRNGHPNASVPPARPEHFEEMKDLAATLSAGLPQVRVDFYELGGKVYFGEYTFYHFRGLVPFEPDGWDVKIGNLWKE